MADAATKRRHQECIDKALVWGRRQIASGASTSVHFYPVLDEIEHNRDAENVDECVCGPGVIPVTGPDGSTGWIVYHHSLDLTPWAESDDDE